MTILLILNHAPYDGTDLTWNALRLAGQLKKDGADVRLFLMNDSVDLARDGIEPPEGSSDLVQMSNDTIGPASPPSCSAEERGSTPAPALFPAGPISATPLRLPIEIAA